MASGEPSRAEPSGEPGKFSLGFPSEFGLKVKAPKVSAWGVLEIGLAARVDASAAGEADGKWANLSVKQIRPSVSVKDVFLRGKIELGELGQGKLHYSKKLRLPFLNTELLKLRLTAAWPTGDAAAGLGLLGRSLLGVSFSLCPERLHATSLVRKAPEYSLQLRPRLGPPQALYDRLGFPGSAYVKASSTLHLTDAPSPRDVRLRLDVHRLDAVVRLYGVDRVKPCRLARNLASEARRLTLADAESEAEQRRVRTAVKVVRVLEAEKPAPDAIDRASAKAREWAHALLVNSCIATAHLKEEATHAAEKLRAALSGPGKQGGKQAASS